MSDFEDTNLFAQQEANRRKSRWIVALFVLFFAWLGFGADLILWLGSRRGVNPVHWQPDFPFLGIVLTIAAIAMVIYSRKTGAEKVLWSSGAQELVEPATDEQRRFANVAEEMAVAASIPRPKLWIVEDPDPNAFATGDDPTRSHVAVTTGLLATLNRDELQAVVGHEFGHIKNLDTQLMTLLAALVGSIILVRDGMARMIGFGGGGRRRSREGSGGGPLVIALLVLWIVSWILAPMVINLLALWVSRKREYLADAMSAQFTRNPLALASALEKIEAADAPTLSIKGGVAHLCITDPLGRQLANKEGFLADAFATHPPMALRIARLKAMGFQELKREGKPLPVE